MIKNIQYPLQTRIVIYKSGNVVADFFVSGIKGCIDADEIKVKTARNLFDGEITIRLEV